MRTYLRYGITSTTMIAIALAAQCAMASIQIDAIGLIAISTTGAGSLQTTTSNYTQPGPDVPIPIQGSFNAIRNPGTLYSANDISIVESNGQIIVKIDMDHSHSGIRVVGPFANIHASAGLSGNSSGSNGIIFTVDTDVPYTLSGAYSEITAGTNTTAQLQARIFDVPTSSFLFGAVKSVSSTVMNGQSLELEGDQLAGVLPAGTYRWDIFASLHNLSSSTSGAGAHATGNFTLVLGSAGTAVIPEATSIAIWSLLGIAGVAITGRRSHLAG